MAKRKKKSYAPATRSVKVISVILAVVLLASVVLLFLSFRRIALILWILLILGLSTAIAVYHAVLKKEEDRLMNLWKYGFIFVMLLLFAGSTYYVFPGSRLLFWLVTLPVSALVGALALFCGFWKNDGFLGRACGYLIAFFFAAMTVFPCMAHLNYLCDFEEPSVETVTVLDKNIDRGRVHRRSFRPNRYELTVLLDGAETEIYVPYAEYQACTVGEPYRIEVYRGAFGVGFYLPESLSN